MDEAYVTLVTNDAYALGALVLGQSLIKVGTNRSLHCIVTNAIARIYTHVTLVDVLDSGDEAHLALIKRPELGVTFTKLHCWQLTQYRKCVFLDADCLVRFISFHTGRPTAYAIIATFHPVPKSRRCVMYI
ncbi:unnamed protein product [Soboliphyme baturini]|uniref:Glycogenin-1 n=1 Tax=Soboliphyme baturini TaxID=241478 RepID=A0A183IJL3_9BILA|nr:unnamed protein product [Soboliphyme baturini]